MKGHVKKNLIIIIFWIVIMFLVWYQEYQEEDYMPLAEKVISFLTFTAASVLISFAFSKTLFKHTVANKKTLPFILKFFLLCICMSMCYAFLKEMYCLLESNGLFRSTYFLDDRKELLASIAEGLPSCISINFLFCCTLLYYEYSELRTTNLKYQLQILDAQITPHFMFNVLNYIYVLMQKDVDMASTLLLKYSDTLRYQLYSGKEDYVKLEKEVQFLKNYVDVEKFRWEGKLDVTCCWEVEDGNRKLPPLLLITFVENAFKYVSRSGSAKGYISIKLKQKGRRLCFDVENTKSADSIKNKNKNSGIGLRNVRTRLDILYGKRYEWKISDKENTYHTKLTLYL